jgi:prephenate dehydratase
VTGQLNRVAFQGEPGAYSEAAVLEHFGPGVVPVPCSSFDQVFDAVETGQCEAGLIPIENSLAGSIHRNYDLLLRHDLKITGEHYLPVHHCLIGLPGATIESLSKVISHPQALAQCEGYLNTLGVAEIEPVYDTAGSVQIARDLGDPRVAAIASRRAAELYQMEILAEGIEDSPDNVTRFLSIGCQVADYSPADQESKTTIVFTLNNQPGALFKALSVFALRDIDLTKIESRPLMGSMWEYLFYIDFAGSVQDRPAQRGLSHLEEYVTMLRVLGSYPRHRLK